MRRKTLLIAIAVLLAVPMLASAQMGRWDDEQSGDFESWIKSGRMRPFIEANYGQSTPKYRGMDGSFATLGCLELKLGYGATDSVNSSLVSLDERYVFGSFLSEDISLTGSADAGEDLSKLSRFGFGNRLGYGYGGKGFAVELYNQNSMNWTSLRAVDGDNASADAQAIFDRYGTQFRFGQLMEAGAKIHVARTVSVSVGVEGAVIFPRYVFWPWLGSAVIYSGVEGSLEYFSEQIVTASPVLGPIIHFLLKNGASLGYYLLLRDDMAWPFDYEQPLTVESYKVGAAITF